MPGNQSEGAVAIDPANPDRVFAFSNLDAGDGMFAALSSDGGATWAKRIIADGKDGLVPASCDPSAAFDDFGNLFIAYMNAPTDAVVVAKSVDGGHTFSRLAIFKGDVDQPTVVTGPGSVWVTFAKSTVIVATGAPVKGVGKIGTFKALQKVPDSNDGNFGDISIGARGQVLVTYMTPIDTSGPAKIYVSLDRDGLGIAAFSKPVLATTTAVGGFRAIPAQRDATIDAEPALAYDRSGKNGSSRVYLVYTNITNKVKADTDIFFRVSRDDGAHWGAARRVNDDTSNNSQFLPRIAVDQSTGNVGMSWHDSRMDTGTGPGTTNRVANDDAQFWGVIAHPTSSGLALAANFQISQGTSNGAKAYNAIDLGDYTGLSLAGGLMVPIWSDNSNSTANNPDGRLHELDMYVALITVT